MVDLLYKKNRKNYEEKKRFGANGGFDSTKEFKEILRKKMGFGPNGRFSLQRKRKNFEKKDEV